MVKRCTSAQKPCMVAGWVWVGGCQMVGKWFAGRVGWCVGWLVPPTPTPPTDHQHFGVKRCASAQNPFTWKRAKNLALACHGSRLRHWLYQPQHTYFLSFFAQCMLFERDITSSFLQLVIFPTNDLFAYTEA